MAAILPGDRIQLGGGLLQVSAAGGLTWTPTAGQAFTVASGGLTVTAGGLTVTAGGLTVSAGGLTITGTTTVTGAFSTSGASGTITSAQGLTVASGDLSLTTGNLVVASNGGAVKLGASSDVLLYRDAANVLAQRNGTNAQALRLYNTFTDASNYERGGMRWSSNLLEFFTEAAGTGTVRNLKLYFLNGVTITEGGGTLVLSTGTVSGFNQWQGVGGLSDQVIGQNTSVHFQTVGSTISAEKQTFYIDAAAHVITAGFATQRFNFFPQPTISAATSLTVTTAATVAIAGAPIAAGAGPAVITNPYALWVQAGATLLAGGLTVSAGGIAVTGNSTITGVTTVTGTLSSGQQNALVVTSTLVNIPTEIGVFSNATYGTVATAIGIDGLITVAASATVTNGRALVADAPSLGVSAAITTASGLYVQNQGGAGITNAYGIYVAAQSGAATTNVGIYVAGGGVTVAAGGASITGTTTVTGAFSTSGASGTITSAQGLTVSAGGAAITGNASAYTGVAAAGGATLLTVTPGAHTAVVAEVNDVIFAAHTQTITGGYATQRFLLFNQPTISAATSLTVTTAATVAIAGAPIAAGAGPAVITNPYALWVQAGATLLAGGLTVSAGGIAVTGNSTITGTLGGLTGLTVASGGATVTAGGLTVTAGNVGIGTGVSTSIAVNITGAIVSGAASQYGVAFHVTYGSDATTAVYGGSYQIITTAAAYTVTTAYSIYASAPSLGVGSAITTLYGFYAANQGAAGVTNAYGIYVAAQSGAATTNIGIYNASVTQLASGVGIGAAPTGSGINIGAASSNNSIWSTSQGAGTATLYIGNASINVTSDMRLKTDIAPSSYDALALIGRLRPVDYTWADPSDTAEVNRNSRGRWTGLIAQEVVDVVPWVVNAPDRTCTTCRAGLACERHEAYWRIEYDQFAGLFVRAFQQMAAKIDTLEARLQAAGIN